MEFADGAYDFSGDYNWRITAAEYEVVPGVSAIQSPSHTIGHMSMYIELPKSGGISGARTVLARSRRSGGGEHSQVKGPGPRGGLGAVAQSRRGVLP